MTAGTKTAALLVSLWAVLSGSEIRAQEKPIIAIFDMEDRGEGLSRQVLDNLTEYLALLLAERGYQIIPREQIRERLLEQKKESLRSCYDQSCQIELGRELAAQKAIATRVLKIADTCQVGATLFDLKKATTERAASEETNCNEKSLLEAVKKIAGRLAGPVEKEVSETAPPPAPAPASEPAPPLAEPAPPPQPAAAEPAPPAGTVSFHEHRFTLGLKLGGVSPSRGDDWAIKLEKEVDSTIYGLNNLQAGFFGALEFNWRFARRWSLLGGLSIFAADTRAVRDTDQNNTLTFISVLAGIRYHWRLASRWELRPGAALGMGRVANGSGYVVTDQVAESHYVKLDGFTGLSLAAGVELAWAISRAFALTADLGFVATPITRGKFDGHSYRLTFPPFVHLMLGAEYGF